MFNKVQEAAATRCVGGVERSAGSDIGVCWVFFFPQPCSGEFFYLKCYLFNTHLNVCFTESPTSSKVNSGTLVAMITVIGSMLNQTQAEQSSLA